MVAATDKKARRRRGRKDDSTVADGKEHTSLLIQLTEEAPQWYLVGNSAERNATNTAKTQDHNNKKNNKKNDNKNNNKKSDNNNTTIVPNTHEMVTHYRERGDQIFRTEVQLALARKNDNQWVESTMRTGTLKDRIAAMSVVLSTSPVHQFHVLQQLLDLTRPSNNSRVARLAAEALVDLFLHTYLPPRRPLVGLAHRPLASYFAQGQRTLSPRTLLLWRFEELVLEHFHTFLGQYLQHTLDKGLENDKLFCLSSVGQLLQTVPTAEGRLLPLLVNKLGDPAKKIAARAAHELRRLLQEHPAMQTVVAREVQQTLHRPHLSPRALYNCVLFLNQLEFTIQDRALPTLLLQTYFRLFEVAIGTNSDNNNNNNNNAPKDKKKSKKNKKKVDSRPTDLAKLNSRLLSALLTGVNRAHPYALASHDMEQHLDALYRVVHAAPPAACTQACLLLFHLVVGVDYRPASITNSRNNHHKNNKQNKQTSSNKDNNDNDNKDDPRRDRFYRALFAKLSDAQLLQSGKHLTQLFNLLYKSIKYDRNPNRVRACTKRLVSTILGCPMASTVAATLYLWNELSQSHGLLQESWQTAASSDAVIDTAKRDPRSALVPVGSDDGGGVATAPAWEMTLLQHHYHPSVVKFTNSLDSSVVLSYDGDPLQDFAIGPFLDKFAYRNPKAKAADADDKNTTNRRSRVLQGRRSSSGLPVNDSAFLERTSVGPDDEFFHRFFVERARRDQVKGIVRKQPDHRNNDDDDDDDDQDELGALDAAEHDIVDMAAAATTDFERYEQAWGHDPAEEAFVDSLAESLMEDGDGATARQGDVDQAVADLDDEDPDTSGWGDLHDGDDDNDDDDNDDDDKKGRTEGNDNSSSSSDEDDEKDKRRGKSNKDDDDDDAFMDQGGDDDDSSSDEDSVDSPTDLGLGVARAKNDDDDDDDASDDDGDDDDGDDDNDNDTDDDEFDQDEEAFFQQALDDEFDDDNGDDDDDAVTFLEDNDDGDDDDEDEFITVDRRRKGGTGGTFASAEDYQDRISESFGQLKRGPPSDDDEDSEEPPAPKKAKRKQKKTKKRSNSS